MASLSCSPGVQWLALLLVCLAPGVSGQTTSGTEPPIPVLRTGTSLTLLDVMVEQPANKLHSRQLLTGLKREDFRLFDNGHEVPLRSFDAGIDQTARPVALWLIVQCNLGYPANWSSTFMRDKTDALRPAFAALHPDDLIGVAHWCDDGEAKVDLEPTHNPDPALATVEALLHAKKRAGVSRQGELALQRMIGDVLTATHPLTPSRLPVFLFLYGDHSATYAEEADEIIKAPLESSGVVFGLNQPGGEVDLSVNLGAPGQISHLIHHYAGETGGEYYSAADPKLFSSALAYILTQVHLRYVLGFKPELVDGQRHSLRVELTDDARTRFANPDIRTRSEYIPVPPQNP